MKSSAPPPSRHSPRGTTLPATSTTVQSRSPRPPNATVTRLRSRAGVPEKPHGRTSIGSVPLPSSSTAAAAAARPASASPASSTTTTRHRTASSEMKTPTKADDFSCFRQGGSRISSGTNTGAASPRSRMAPRNHSAPAGRTTTTTTNRDRISPRQRVPASNTTISATVLSSRPSSSPPNAATATTTPGNKAKVPFPAPPDFTVSASKARPHRIEKTAPEERVILRTAAVGLAMRSEQLPTATSTDATASTGKDGSGAMWHAEPISSPHGNGGVCSRSANPTQQSPLNRPESVTVITTTSATASRRATHMENGEMEQLRNASARRTNEALGTVHCTPLVSTPPLVMPTFKSNTAAARGAPMATAAAESRTAGTTVRKSLNAESAVLETTSAGAEGRCDTGAATSALPPAPQTPRGPSASTSTTTGAAASPTPRRSSSRLTMPRSACRVSAAVRPRTAVPGQASPASATFPTPNASTTPLVSLVPVRNQSTILQQQRAAAMLSETLSVVRPMAPVVHVRIRPVLPTIGESVHRRHVYVLDHENVMITGTRSGQHTAVGTRGGSNVDRLHPDLIAATASGTGWAGRTGSQQSSPGHRTSSNNRKVTRVATAGGTATTSAAARAGNVSALLYSNSGRACLHPRGEESLPSSSTVASPVSGRRGLAGTSTPVTPASTKGTRGHRGESPHGPHQRTFSWYSQISEDGGNGADGGATRAAGDNRGSPAIEGRLSHSSNSPSPNQMALPMVATAVTGLSSTVSTPGTRPLLPAYARDRSDSLYDSTVGGVVPSGRLTDGGGSGRMGRPDTRAGTGGQRSPTLSPTTGLNTRTTTQRSSARSLGSATSPSKNFASTRDALPLTGRSALGASVSVSALSVPGMLRTAGIYPDAEETALSRTQDSASMSGGSGAPVDGLRRATGTASAHATGASLKTVGGASASAHMGNMAAAGTGNTAAAAAASGATGAEQHYRFEFVHDEEATQADVFEESVLRFADEALLAQNVAIICYGPTGSGKTYSMMGSQAQSHTHTSTTSGTATATTLKSVGSGFNALGTATSSSPNNARSATGTAGRSRTRTPDTGRRRHVVESAKAPNAAHGIGKVPAQGAAQQHSPKEEEENSDDASDDNSWPQLGSSWQYGYTARAAAMCDGANAAAAAGERDEGGTGRGGPDGWSRKISTSGLSTGEAAMSEMGILPRLVHTLLERRGEAITIRPEARRNDPARGIPSQGSPMSTPRPNTSGAAKVTSLSLTLRDLTFYGIELYMDELCDLLDPGKRPIQTVSDTGGLAALCQRVDEARDYRIHGSRGGASQVAINAARTGGGIAITSLADLRRAYRLAHNNRVTARHAQNDTSSRSHAIFLLQLDFDLTENMSSSAAGGISEVTDEGATAPVPSLMQRVHSYVAMVDLAGCERVKQTKVEGEALREAQYINKSLSALSSVVLSLHRNNAHVPYRDSKLTRLLRPCLEGGRVLTLVHVAPCSSAETVNALKFADQIRHTHIPTHVLTPTSSKHKELLDVFADLIDPMQGLWEAQVRQARQQLSRLCADVRLAYFSRAVGAVVRHGHGGALPSSASVASDAVSALSDLSELEDDLDDGASLSPGDVLLDIGPPPLPADAPEKERCRYAVQALMCQLMGPIHQHQCSSMREAIHAIRHRKAHKINAHAEEWQRRIDAVQAAVQKLSKTNAKLASENRTPLPRDPHALELSRQMREISEQMGEAGREQTAITTLTTALRQRLANQDVLEATVDEQLNKVQRRTAQALQMVSAATAARPAGVRPLPDLAYPAEPTLPTGSPISSAIATDTEADPELRDIAHQQMSLAKELAALRVETACFEKSTAVWEGLWTRAMRKEVVTALTEDVYAMERIILDRHALAVLGVSIPVDATPTERSSSTAGEMSALETATPLTVPAPAADVAAVGLRGRMRGSADNSTHLTTPDSVEATAVATSILNDRSSSGSTTPTKLTPTHRAALWERLDAYLHGSGVRNSGGPLRPVLAASGQRQLHEKTMMPVESGMGGQMTPPRPRLRDTAGSPSSATAATAATGITPPRLGFSAERLRQRGSGSPNATSGRLQLMASPRTVEEAVPNPLTLLELAHCTTMANSVLRPTQEDDAELRVSTPPSSPRRAVPSTATLSEAVAAALCPLVLDGNYGEEQLLQEAGLHLLLREGVPCEACCLGNTATNVLRHYVLPETADAPMAVDMEQIGAGAAGSVSKGEGEQQEPAVHQPSSGNAMATQTRYAVPQLLSSPPPGISQSHRESCGPSATDRARSRSTPTLLDAMQGMSCTTRLGRLRLVRMPRKANCYALEFVYTHHGPPVAPRLQAALQGKSETALAIAPWRSQLEQMVDALPTVHGVAGRGGTAAAGPGASNVIKEHRLFSIPLYEPSLHLHLHVLEEGLTEMSTPVAAKVMPETSSKEAQTTTAARDGTVQMCVARRPERGTQMVLEVQGVPFSASTRRNLLATMDAKKAAQKVGKRKTLHTNSNGSNLRSNSRLNREGATKKKATGSGSITTIAGAATPAATEVSSAPDSAGWNDLVLAKRLGSGGELMLPSSCILSNKGSCALVLRFPEPLFTPTARTTSVEAVVGALTGVLRPAVSVPELRQPSTPPSRSLTPNKRTGKRRSSVGGQPFCPSTKSTEKVGGGEQCRRSHSHSASRSPRSTDRPAVVCREIVTYAHVPYTVFATATMNGGQSFVPPTTADGVQGRNSKGEVSAAAVAEDVVLRRADSLDGVVNGGGGVLGQTLQSSCSPSHATNAAAAAMAHRADSPAAGQAFPPSLSVINGSASTASSSVTALARTASGVTVESSVLADQQHGATLQVQFHWTRTPRDLLPPRASVSGVAGGGEDSGGALATAAIADTCSTPRQGTSWTSPSAPPQQPEGRDMGVLSQQVRTALGVLAQLSYVTVEGRRAQSQETEEVHRSSVSASTSVVTGVRGGAALYPDAMHVATLLRQLDTYRQHIRQLFRQQLYDAEDIVGGDGASMGGGGGASLRDFQHELRHAVSLPRRAQLHYGNAASPLANSPGHPSGSWEESRAGKELLDLEERKAAPDTQLTVPEARSVCAAVVPWSIWQWAYRWDALHALLRRRPQHDSWLVAEPAISFSNGGSTSPTANSAVQERARTRAVAAWLPLEVAATSSAAEASAPANLVTPVSSQPLGLSFDAAGSLADSFSSSASSGGYLMTGYWLAEARLVAHSKRVWLPDVLCPTIPSYLESCTTDYAGPVQ